MNDAMQVFQLRAFMRDFFGRGISIWNFIAGLAEEEKVDGEKNWKCEDQGLGVFSLPYPLQSFLKFFSSIAEIHISKNGTPYS